MIPLQAMYFEAKGKYEEAEKVITKMLEQRPDSEFAVKRQVEYHCMSPLIDCMFEQSFFWSEYLSQPFDLQQASKRELHERSPTSKDWFLLTFEMLVHL